MLPAFYLLPRPAFLSCVEGRRFVGTCDLSGVARLATAARSAGTGDVSQHYYCTSACHVFSSGDTPQALPPFVQALVDSLVASRVYEPQEAPNHCLINDYRDGAGIPAHQDGPLYLDKVRPIIQGLLFNIRF